MLKSLPAPAGDLRDAVSIPGSEDPRDVGMATSSSTLAWRIPWAEEPGGLQSIVSQSQIQLKQFSTQAWGWQEFRGAVSHLLLLTI